MTTNPHSQATQFQGASTQRMAPAHQHPQLPIWLPALAQLARAASLCFHAQFFHNNTGDNNLIFLFAFFTRLQHKHSACSTILHIGWRHLWSTCSPIVKYFCVPWRAGGSANRLPLLENPKGLLSRINHWLIDCLKCKYVVANTHIHKYTNTQIQLRST